MTRLARRRPLLAGAVLALAAGILAGCGTSAPGTPQPSAPSTPGLSAGSSGSAASASAAPAETSLAPVPATDARLARFYGQTPAWSACGDGGELDCASVRVPLDYARPDGPTLDLAVARKRATASRQGVLFMNPGGPGASGTGYLRFFNTAGLEGFDVVSWDPRGVGGSHPVRCLEGADADAYVALDLSPDTPAENEALIEGSRRFGQACLRNTGDVLAHISTQENARDLDILRGVLGEERLTYVGQSYGTMLGAYYAELFPGRVSRMVLDAGVDVTGRSPVAQTVGFDRALDAFTSTCAATGCRWGSTREEVIASLRAMLGRLDRHPLTVGDQKLTQSQAAAGLAGALYAGTLATPLLERALDELDRGDGSLLKMASNRIYGRDASGGYGGMLGAFQAIPCADRLRISVAEAGVRWAEAKRQAPFFGEYWGPQYVCPTWPVAPVGPLEKVDAAGAPPILVVGGRNDPVAPYEYSEDLARRLNSGVLLTFEGQGHVAYGRSACVDDAVRGYLNRGVVPADGTRCS